MFQPSGRVGFYFYTVEAASIALRTVRRLEQGLKRLDVRCFLGFLHVCRRVFGDVHGYGPYHKAQAAHIRSESACSIKGVSE